MVEVENVDELEVVQGELSGEDGRYLLRKIDDSNWIESREKVKERVT
jgi:hypothetical protein